jgi:rare lipoprotein A
MASWYGHPYHGRATASGEVYDMEAPTGAHPTLPFGTRLRVENLDNGRSTTLTVNDRGPFAKERILDVSRRVAEELGMLGPGTARVRITILEVHQPHVLIDDGSTNLGSRTRTESFGEEVR